MKLRIFNNIFIVLVFAFIVSLMPTSRVSAVSYTSPDGGLFMSVNGITDSYYTTDQHISFSMSTYYSASNSLVFGLDSKVCILNSSIPCANPYNGATVAGGYDIQASSALPVPATPGQYSIYAQITYTLPNYNVMKINVPEDPLDDVKITGFYTQLQAVDFIADTYPNNQDLYDVVYAPSNISSPNVIVKTFNVLSPIGNEPMTVEIKAITADNQVASSGQSVIVQSGNSAKIQWKANDKAVWCGLNSNDGEDLIQIESPGHEREGVYNTLPLNKTTVFTINCND